MSNRFAKNPLDAISDSDFKEFLIAKENNFTKLTEMGVVVYDYSKWYNTYHNLLWHCYYNHETILEGVNLANPTNINMADILINKRKL